MAEKKDAKDKPKCTCDDYPGEGSVLIHSHTCPMKGKSE